MYCVLSAQVNSVHTTPGSVRVTFLSVATKKHELAAPLPRAKSVVLPGWWLEMVNREAADFGVVKLGRALAVAIDRPEGAWDHSAVSRFLRDEITTAPMAEAFSVLFDLPKPFYVARSKEEATDLQRAAKKHESPTSLSKEQERRLAANDQLLEAEEEASADQTRQLESVDEGASRRGRSRRAARRRAPTS